MRPTKLFLPKYCLLFSVALTPIHTFATEDELFDLSFEELFDVTLSIASKSEQTIAKAPSTVTVFTRQDIVRLSINNVEDILNFVPGMQVTRNESNNMGHTIQARGRYTLGGRSVLVLLNNQRLNHDWTGGANWTTQLVSANNVKQIEVIRGPGSALYGSDAFNAVINIITDHTLNEGGVELGSFDSKRGYAAISSGPNEDIKTSLFLNYFSDNGDDYTTEEGTTQDPVYGYEVSGFVGYQNLEFNLRHVFREAEDFYQFGAIDNNINKTTSKNTMVSAKYKFEPMADFSLEAFVYYHNRYQKSFFEPLDPEVMSFLFSAGIAQDPSPVLGGPLYELSEAGINLDGKYALGSDHNLSFGLVYRKPKMDTLRLHGNHDIADITTILVLGQPGQIRYYGQSEISANFGEETSRTNIGLYVQDQISFNEKLDGTFGIRFDDYSDFGSTTNPRASLVYSANQSHSFKLIYGEAFRAPSHGELTVFNNPVDSSNPDLLPEKIATSEIAWILNKDDFRLVSTLYHSKIDDVIEIALSTERPPLTEPVNGGTLEISGIEIEAKKQFSDTFAMDLNWSHNFKMQQNPQILARNTASIIFSANLAPWHFNLNALYKDKVEHERLSQSGLLQRTDLSDYWLVNFNTRYQFSSTVTAKLAISNLFDKDYYSTNTSAETIYNGVPNRTRQITLALEYKW